MIIENGYAFDGTPIQRVTIDLSDDNCIAELEKLILANMVIVDDLVDEIIFD